MLLKLIFICYLSIVLVNAVVEREAARLCVIQKIELDKCNDVQRILIENRLPNRLECILSDVNGCIEKIKNNEADVMVMDSKVQHLAFDKGLRTILWEYYRNDDVIIALGDENLTPQDLKTMPLDFNVKDLRLVHSALLFNKIRNDGKNTCEVKRNQNINDNSIRFLRIKDLNYNISLLGKKLICSDLTRQEIIDYRICNFETGPINAIVSRNDADFQRLGQLIGIFNEIVGYFGPHGHLRDFIRLFGVYKGERDVIFNDDTQYFTSIRYEVNGINESAMNDMLCQGNVIET